MWQFWVDRGGTFTDLVAKHPDGGFGTLKLLSENPDQYPDAAVEGIRRLMNVAPGADLPSGRIAAVKMGTTVATNALLERKGEPTLLLITRGFGDLLQIGYQNRPRLFDLHITRPKPLYETVEEVEERLDAKGKVVMPLNEADARAALQRGFDAGLRAVAITFLHAYLDPRHEHRVAEIARETGFTQVSSSAETSRLIKLVGRGDTTVVDAYLSPILRRYVEQISNALNVARGGCEQLFFMQSNGGLTDAARFQGRDAILSGPAGGVVGMVRTAGAAGHDRLIGFDMGGTSTDVCHFAGDYERSFETEVAGVRMRAPMMNIHTVAAGGGSILGFADGRYQVGPESAGAYPGPACYRNGGPLTVTDCNVMLGKLQPDQFPRVFGPDANQPLDVAIVRSKFIDLANRISAETDQPPLSPEDTAAGFLRIAVENMANAIKEISVQRGYDVARYTLNCFGGAGGQHACLVADALGMTRVFLHPYAGVLSAFGMGLADIRALKERQIDQPVSAWRDVSTICDDLTDDAMREVMAQGIAPTRIAARAQAHIRYAGSHQSLPVDFSDDGEMRAAFETAHKARFGFSAPERDLIIDMISVEAIGDTGESADLSDTLSMAPSSPVAEVQVFIDGAPQSAPIFDRTELPAGQRIHGPAIIVEPTGTNVVEPGWAGEHDAQGNLILTRLVAKAREVALGTDADPIMLEVFNNLFMSIAEQMGASLANTAYSVNIKERLDFSCALFDGRGDLVANAPHVPVHLGSMSESVRTIARLNAGQIKPGDAFMLNAPFNGGTHLPDVTVITPVFDATGREILFYVGSRGHHADIGGRTPGSAPPDSTHIDEEGVLIDNFKLVENGTLREAETRALLASGRYPCRNIDHNLADLEAQVAANATGMREVHRMIDTFGTDVVMAYMGHVQANAEASVRRVIGRLKDCTFTYPLDIGAEIHVAISVDHATGSAEIDFTGTSPQHSGNYNAPFAICQAVVLYVFRTLVGQDIPMNEGCLAPIRIIAPEGSMIHPSYPAAVIAGNTEVSQAIADCLFGALGVIAGSQGTMNNFIWGNAQFQNYETIAGGTGAGPDFDGADAVHSHMTNTLMTDPEVLELRFPIRVERFAVRHGSGGDGRQRGGNGIERDIRFFDDVTVTTLTSHREIPPHGMAGGGTGATGRNTVIRANGEQTELPGNAEVALNVGDVFRMETPGGGGFGEP